MPGRDDGRTGYARDLLLLPVALTALWTLAYQFVLVARWPAWSSIALLFVFSALVLIGLARWKGIRPEFGYTFHWAHSLLPVMGLAVGGAILFVLRPNQDDVVYFHRALTQLAHLSDPILTRQTSVDVDAAAFSPVHLATSHELLMAFLAHSLGCDPLYFYQVVGHFIAAFSIPFVFYFCARCFGLNRWSAAGGAACVIIFLLIDRSGLASFGNTALCRMWQGKAIVWILFPPVALSLTYRYMETGNRRDVVWLTLLGISGVGLSNSALYLLPAVVGCAGLAKIGLCLIPRCDTAAFRNQFIRSLYLGIPLIYPVAILLLLKLNVIPQPIDKRGFGAALISWRQGIDYVVGPPGDLWRDVVILLLIPLVLLRGSKGLFLFFYTCAILVFCLNPLLAHFWMRNITAACYFRLVYLLPIPLLCVFLPLAIAPEPAGRFEKRASVWGIAATLAVLLGCAFAYRGLSLAPRNKTLAWKSPLAYQILPANLQFAKAAGPYIAQSKLLAPAWTASCELPLLFPEMKVVAPRLATHYFSNAGKGQEGALRRMAQAFVEGEKGSDRERNAALARSFATVVTSGRATALAVPNGESQRVLAALQTIDPRWHRVLDAGGLVLIVPGAGQRPARDQPSETRRY